MSALGTVEIIDRIPFELEAAVQGDDLFCDIPVVTTEKGNFNLELAQKQAVLTSKGNRNGIAVAVLQIVADYENPEVAFGPMRYHCAFQVIENVELNNGPNGTKKSCRMVARRLAQIVPVFSFVGLTSEFLPGKPCIEPLALLKDGKLAAGLVGNQVNFITFENSDEVQSQVARPSYTPYSGDGTPQVQIDCVTPGAEIWYTTDDTVPIPARLNSASTAKAYVAPIDIPDAGFILRARAFAPGMVGSQVSREEVTIE